MLTVNNAGEDQPENPPDMQSTLPAGGEVRQLIEQIDHEAIAMYRGMYGLAETARHAFISARYAVIDKAHSRLGELIGEEATPLVSQMMDTIGVLIECEQALKNGGAHDVL